MTDMEFLQMLSGIDEDLVTKAATPVPFRQKRGFKIALIAAVLAFAMLLTPIAGAFALAVGYFATRDDVNDGSEPQAPTQDDAQQKFTPGGLVGELLGGIDWGALKDTVGADGNVNWKDFFAVLQGNSSETVGASGHVFEAVKLDDGTMKITKFVNNGSETIVEIPETVAGAKVTVIGDGVFAKNENITHVSLPDTITEIEAEAFYGCENLITVDMSVNVRSIGEGAFQHCTSLTTINLPYALKAIGAYCFADCPNLSGIVIRSTLTDWGENVFSGSLKSVTIENGVKEIYAGAFTNSYLQEIDIPHSVTTIGDHAFMGSTQLTIVTLSEGLEYIGKDVFNQTNINELTIPSTVTNMYDIDFTSCPYLVDVIFKGNAPTLTEYPAHDKLSPAYNVYYTINATGFSEPDWFGYSSSLLAIQTEPFVLEHLDDHIFTEIPMYNVEVLGQVGLSSSLDQEVTVLDSYSEYEEFAHLLTSTRYDREYFEEFAIVLIQVQQCSSEKVLGLAGMGAQLYSYGGVSYFGLYPVVKFDCGEGGMMSTDIFNTYVLAEVKRSDIRTDNIRRTGSIYAYDIHTQSASAYHPGLVDKGK